MSPAWKTETSNISPCVQIWAYINMRHSILSLALMAGSTMAQGDLAGLLSSQPDLSTLLELVSLVDGLADTLAAASNITIFAPTNDAFARVPRDEPEGAAIEYRNETVAVAALLANHVFKGVYPSDVITDIPTFAQTLLDNSYITATQPFSNITGGAYNGLVKNGDDVCVLSGEQTISTVTQADIKLGEGITIHKVDTVLSFGAPLQLFTYRAGYLNMNAALEAANLGFDVGLSGPDQKGLNISDFTIFIPTNEAFDNIGSIIESADLETIQDVLRYHIIPNNVIFAPSLGNVTIPSFEGTNLTFTVFPDGTAWVNNAKITFPNTILFNCVAHVIDTVLAPGEFDRAALEPSARAADRLSFPNASKVVRLPFTSVAFEGDLMTYSSTPALLQTVAAVATGASRSDAATSATTTSNGSSTSPPLATYTGSAISLATSGVMLMAVAVGVAALLM
ncbi:FAS1 domain-containing protein [Aureobasidium subglaciale]|nr:FAS1 domain-containing protein [Aureobasidium subglaciale]KAI5218017.1 FAS1 domain-containing protein [Aureobasidium subglaciale]KAI5221659.1 FAS1 domain-containing protein [Aureobasidium subglaciale]KAI5259075.1 FAS1 domain-containing protein [Aureobasidium subglaciale]